MVRNSGYSFQPGELTLSPDVANGTTGQDVACSIPNLGNAAVDAVSCTLKAPSGTPYVCRGDGSYCVFDLPSGAELGFWTVEDAFMQTTNRENVRWNRTDIQSSGGDWYLDVNSTGGQGGTGGAPAGYDYCTQSPTTTLNGEGYSNSAIQPSTNDTVLLNTCARVSAGGAVVGVGETTNNALASFNAAVQFYDSGTEKYFRAQGEAGWVEPQVKLNWLVDTWYKIRIVADSLNGTYYAEVADCNGGDDYYWIDHKIDMVGTEPFSLAYIKGYAPASVSLFLHTESWVTTLCGYTDCAGGTIAVDVSARPSQCVGTWTLEPGGFSGTGDLATTAVPDGSYLMHWPDIIACQNPVVRSVPTSAGLVTGDVMYAVFDDDVVVDLSENNYTPLTEVTGRVQICLDGDCTASPPGPSWSVDAKAPYSGQYTASGSGDDGAGGTVISGLYSTRTYVLTCDPVSGYAVSPDEMLATTNLSLNTLFCLYTTL